MTIRDATYDDVGQLVQLGFEFVATSEYRDLLQPDEDAVALTMRRLIEGGVVFVAEEGEAIVGMLGMGLFAHPFTGRVTAGEMFWFVKPDARGSIGIRLLRRATQWAEDHGAVSIQMVAPNEDVARIYDRLGYRKVETSYQRALR